jgi:uncharacterized membrane protein
MASRSVRDLVLILLPWLALPVVAWILFDAREALPDQVAVHFGLDGAPDRWVSQSTFFAFSLVLLTAMLALFSVRSLRARAGTRLYAVLASQYVLVAVLGLATWQVVRFNRDGVPISVGLLLGGVAVAVVAGVLAGRRVRR